MKNIDTLKEIHEKYCECLDCTHYVESSSQYGLHPDEFNHLSQEDLIKLNRLIARIMERAYRRGVQQAIVLNKHKCIDRKILDDLAAWRYENDLDISFGLDGFKSSSIKRLNMEENLHELGFPYER